MSSPLRVLLVVLCAAVVAAAIGRSAAPSPSAVGGPLLTRDGDTIEISPTVRDDGLRFAPGVAPADRAWILAAVSRARPEAARLIAEVDGLVEVRTDLRDPRGALGVTQSEPNGIVVSFECWCGAEQTMLTGRAADHREPVAA